MDLRQLVLGSVRDPLQVTEVTKSGWVKVKGAAGDGYVSAKLVK